MKIQLLTATKEFTWDMAHMLTDHEGLCQNLHGHTYKMLVTVSRSYGDSVITEEHHPANGMIVDFKELKGLVQEHIVKPLDHALVINGTITEGFEAELLELAHKYQKKVVVLSYRPTAENMAEAFFKLLQETFFNTGYNIVSLRLYETPTSYAEVSI